MHRPTARSPQTPNTAPGATPGVGPSLKDECRRFDPTFSIGASEHRHGVLLRGDMRVTGRPCSIMRVVAHAVVRDARQALAADCLAVLRSGGLT